MLKGCNNAQLIINRINEKCIPFYQIWEEVVDQRTLDVYQYRVLTSLSALKELEEVIEKTLSGLFDSDANIEACREETLYILNNDTVLQKYKKAILNRLKSSIGEKPNSPSKKNKMLRQIKYSVKEIERDYLKLVIQELKDCIDVGDIRRIEWCANIVASQCVNNEWSAKALSGLLRYFRNNKDFEEEWRMFSEELLSENLISHYVFINIPFRQQNSQEQENTLNALQKLGLDIKTSDQLIDEFTQVTDLSTLLNSKRKYFCLSVEARDIYSAAHNAIRNISEKINLASFYNLVSAWDLKTVTLVVINSNTRYHRAFTAEKLYKTHDYVDSSGRIFETTRQIFSDEKKRFIRDKLQGSFGYANISRASLFQEEKYMNLWVALESLARTDMYSNIISNVKETLPAAVCLRYIYRIVRNYVEDCCRCGVLYTFSRLEIDMQQESKQKLVEETISIFNDEELYLELLEKCNVNDLLKYRTECIHKIITNVSCIKKKIENHYKHVHWHIQRLYRIRNEIAHSAMQEESSLIIYIEHLYDYLSTYISEIVTCLADKKLDTIEETLCYIRDNYDVFMEFTINDGKEILRDTVLKTGIIDLL